MGHCPTSRSAAASTLRMPFAPPGDDCAPPSESSPDFEERSGDGLNPDDKPTSPGRTKLLMLLRGSRYLHVMKSSSGNGRPLKMETDRLLAGEDPETIRPRDAHHWITIYAELVGFKNQLLVRVNEGMEGVSSAARGDLQEDVDLVVAQ